MPRTTEHFVAVAYDGRSIITVEEDSIPAPNHDDPTETIVGQKRAFTESGKPCERIDERSWRVPSIGIVRRI